MMRRVVGVVALAVLAACAGGGNDGGRASGSPEAGLDGRVVAESAGCVACHGADGQGTVGPAWQGLLESSVHLEDGTTVVADEDYIRRSIVDPSADIVSGFTIEMPEVDLTPAEVDALVAYISSL